MFAVRERGIWTTRDLLQVSRPPQIRDMHCSPFVGVSLLAKVHRQPSWMQPDPPHSRASALLQVSGVP
jgi:hypothetical protein